MTVERDEGARFGSPWGAVSWTVVGDATMEMERGDARAVDVNVFEMLIPFARGSRRAQGSRMDVAVVGWLQRPRD